MIEIKNLFKQYKPKKGQVVKAVNDISLSIADTGMVFILGKSGSGKSTLLNLIGGLDSYDNGEIIVKGKSSKRFSQAEFDSLRNTYIGFIFQEYNILNEFNVGQNIALAMQLQGEKATSEKVNDILKLVDLDGFGERRPNELSGGQKQRVAIARALIKHPDIILADEPTGALDSNTGKQVFETLQNISRDKLVIIVSHDREFAEQYGDRVIELADGKVISDITKTNQPKAIASSNICVVGDAKLEVNQGYQLTESDLVAINKYIKNCNSAVAIDVSQGENSNQSVPLTMDTGSSFDNTASVGVNAKQYNEGDFKLIKSRLPLSNAIKMGANSMKIKPIRLIITVLLSAISFMMFGMVDSFASYNAKSAIINSTNNSQLNYYSVSRKVLQKVGIGYQYYDESNMTENDIDSLNNKYDDTSFYKVTALKNGAMDNISEHKASGYYAFRYGGILPVDSQIIKNLGYSVNGRLPASYDEVAITEYCAEHFVEYGYESPYINGTAVGLEISKTGEMIGKTITVDGNNKTIVGIVDTKFDPAGIFDGLKGDISTDLLGYMSQMQYSSYVSTAFHNMVFGCSNYATTIADNNVQSVDTWLTVVLSNDTNNSGYASSIKYTLRDNVVSLYGLTTKASQLNSDDVVVNYNYLPRLDREELASTVHASVCNGLLFKEYLYEYGAIDLSSLAMWLDENAATMTESQLVEAEVIKQSINEAISDYLTDKALTLRCFDDKNYLNNGDKGFFLDDLDVVAVVFDKDINMFMSQSGISELGYDSQFRPYSKVIASVTSDYGALLEQFIASYDESFSQEVVFSLSSPIIDMVQSFDSLIKGIAEVFMYVGIALAIFASVMMTNFIATSIVHKKREIGILRAVGARGKDVFSVFLSESMIIALINWVVAIVGSIIVTIAINNSIASGMGFAIALVTVSFRQIVLVLGISVLVAIVSSWLPVWRMSRKKPIDTILDK